jgi:hypothetical protein
MVTQSDYSKREVELALSVLVELMTVLGEFRDHIVLVGGWVPYFLIEEKRHEHTGSLDIDIALDLRTVSDDSYRTILQLMMERGYVRRNQPFIFDRTIEGEDKVPMVVEIDLLSGEYGGTGRSHRTQNIQDVKARKARGCDLVFDQSFTIKLKKRMPDGAINEVEIKVADVVPFLVMKGMALWERYKEKHAYDIYFTVWHYPRGLEALTETFRPHMSNKFVQEGPAKIKARFQDIDSPGPVWVVNFLEIVDAEERERVQRDVFERVNAWSDSVGVEPYGEKEE